jgi:hypothetical protein
MAIDGIGGSAFAGFNYCWIQPRMATPKAQWSLDAARPVDFYTDWQRLPESASGLMFPTSRHKRRHARPVAR